MNKIISYLLEKKTEVGLLIFSTLAVIITVLLISNLKSSYDVRSRAARPQNDFIGNIKIYNTQLTQLSRAKKKNKSLITALASMRKRLLLAEIKKNPGQFLNYTLPLNTRELLRNEVNDKTLFERDEELKGRLNFIVKDNFKDIVSEVAFQITTSTREGLKKTYTVHPTQSISLDFLNREASIQGVTLDSEITATPGNIKIDQPVPQGGEIKTTGNLKMAILMFNFSNYRLTPYTKQDVESVAFTGQESVNSFYQENSYDKTTFPGSVNDVYGWLEIDSTNASCNDNIFYWAEKATFLATQQGFNPSNYDHIAYLFPYSGDCPWGGIAFLGGNQIWLNGMSIGDHISYHTFVHELGHNFGLLHANSIKCGNKAINTYDQCQTKEYWDLYSSMGIQDYHFNAAFKKELGYLEEPQVKEVDASGTYTLSPLEVAEGLKALKILKRDTNQYYFLEYRQPVLYFDQSIPETAQNVTIRIWDKNQLIINNVAGSFLIDTTPLTDNVDEGLSDGSSFQDDINNISITQINHNSSSATVSVTLPSITFSPTATPTPAFGKAIKLNTVNPGYVEIPSSTRILMGGKFSIGVWVKPDNNVINGPNRSNPSFILAKEGIPNEAWGYSLDIANGKVEFGVNLKKPDGTRVRKMLFGKSVLTPDTWYFINAIKSDNNLSLFVNGDMQEQKSIGSSGESITEKETTPLTIGCAKIRDFPSCLSQFSGEIDEIVLYTNNPWLGYPAAPFSLTTYPAALWHLDGNAQDATGYGQNGQINGNVEFTDSNLRR